MEYLKAFTIGSSGLVLFPFLSSISRDKRFEFKKHLSLILPFYYGFMSMLVIFIKKTYKLSLEVSIMIVFVISYSIIYFINNYYNDKYNKGETVINSTLLKRNDRWLQVITFIILYFLLTNFSKYEALKIFVIGSSIFSYYINFVAASGGNLKRLNYKYEYFAPPEPLGQGILLVIAIMVSMKVFKMNLINSLLMRNVILVGSALLATIFLGWTKTIFGECVKGLYMDVNVYNYSFERYAAQLFLAGTVKIIIFYYLITRLK